MVKSKLLGLNGKEVKKISLPSVFGTTYRPDVIRRSFLAQMSQQFQPQGRDPRAGKKTTAASWGVGHGVSRVPRVKGSRTPSASRGAFIPFSVGGRKTHPPRSDKIIIERINRKERTLALKSAIAATAVKELVHARGHQFSETVDLPMVCVDKLEKLERTSEVASVLEKLGVGADLQRTKSSKKIRAGRGKSRGRRYKQAQSILIVARTGTPIFLASRNIPGVVVCTPQELSIGHLAPGGIAGRLTMWTASALDETTQLFKEAKK
jgi:large subunit ribosomal protein L4e